MAEAAELYGDADPGHFEEIHRFQLPDGCHWNEVRATPQNVGAALKHATHLVILSNAAKRDDNAVLPLSKSLKIKGAAVTKTLQGLCKKGLLEEQPAPRGAVAWHETDDGGRLMLVISPAGLDAIGIEPEDGGQDDTRSNAIPSINVDPALAETGGRNASAGATATAVVKSPPARPPAKNPTGRAAKPKGGKAKHSASKTPGEPGKAKGKTPAAPPTVRAGTKQALLIDLLKRKKGATIDDIVQATGWQAHSVRGAISGTLKKKLGLTVTSEPVGKRGRVYRIAIPGHQSPAGEGAAQDA